MDDTFKAMLAAFSSPEISACRAAIEAIAGYKLSAADRQPFLYFHGFLTNPQPAFISEWRADHRLEKWYHRFANGILGDVQNSFACVLYHHGRILNIESSVIEAVEKFNYRQVLGRSTVALGNTLAWDFEYQAFILAFRRCLDYLARAICTYFRNDFHSFRKLGPYLEKAAPESLGRLLAPLHAKYNDKFDFVLSDGERKSIRDKISHYEYVPAGTINLSRCGFMVAGGGEQLGISNESGVVSLSEALNQHVANLRGCVKEMIFSFVDAMQADQPKCV